MFLLSSDKAPVQSGILWGWFFHLDGFRELHTEGFLVSLQDFWTDFRRKWTDFGRKHLTTLRAAFISFSTRNNIVPPLYRDVRWPRVAGPRRQRGAPTLGRSRPDADGNRALRAGGRQVGWVFFLAFYGNVNSRVWRFFFLFFWHKNAMWKKGARIVKS